MPLISIVTPALNCDSALWQTIHSINSQDWHRIEHVIVCVDSEPALMPEKTSHFSRLILRRPPRGVYDAINEGLKQCTGQIIGILNAGDIYTCTDALSHIAGLLDNRHADPDYVYGPVVYFNKAGRIVRRYHCPELELKQLCRGIYPPHPSLYMRRDALSATGFYATDYKICGDFDMWLRLAQSQLKGYKYSTPLAAMASDGMSASWHSRLITNPRERLACLRAHGLPSSPIALLARYPRLLHEFFNPAR